MLQEKVMTTYRNKGFVLTKEDEQALHMSYSPFRVPRGLTKIQIRRRINHYLKHGDQKTLKDFLGVRYALTFNGKEVISGNYVGEIPHNTRETKKFLKNLLGWISARKVIDRELL